MTNATWSVQEYVFGWFPAPNECIAKHYGYNSDTIINGRFYAKLYGNNLPADYPYQDVAFNLPTATYVAGVREDPFKKVWIVPDQDTTEILYYDFALDSGDTFCFNYFGGVCLPVQWVDSILILGSYRKQIHFYNSMGNPEVWIEGIGSTTGWFEWQYTGSAAWSLLCHDYFWTPVYQISTNCHCDTYTVGISELLSSTVSIFPNPTSGRISISLEEASTGILSVRNSWSVSAKRSV